MAALGLLAQQPGSGYDLLKTFEKSMANVWPATQSQLYGELNRLADDRAHRGDRHRAPRPQGVPHHARRAHRTAAVDDEPEDDPPLRDASLLRVFLLGELEPEEARRHMVAVAEHADSEVKRLEALSDSIDWTDGDGLFFGRAALEYGLRADAMEAEWARWVIDEIDRAPHAIDPSTASAAAEYLACTDKLPVPNRSTASLTACTSGGRPTCRAARSPRPSPDGWQSWACRSPLVEDLARAGQRRRLAGRPRDWRVSVRRLTVAASGRR